MDVALATVKTTFKGNILIVDDDPDLRLMLTDMLQAEGYTGQGVGSQAEAIQAFQDDAWDLVVTDMCLEDRKCTGLELIDFVMQRDDTIPVILITGYPSITHAVDAIKRGAVDFLTKPFDREILLHQVQKALQERRLRLENRRLQAEVNKTAVIEKLNRELDHRISELYRLYTISEGLNEFLDSSILFDRIAGLSAEVTDAQRVAVLVFDRHRRYLRIKAALGIPTEVVRETKIHTSEGVIGEVALSGKPQRIDGPRSTLTDADQAAHRPPQNTANHAPLRRRQLNYFDQPDHAALCLPLVVGREVFGVIHLADKLDGSEFTREDEQIMQTLVEKAGIRLENQALYEGIYSNLVDTLNALVTTLEAKDPYTREHSQRVTEYGIALARYMGLDDDAAEMINFAGMLHDIGKIGVRDEILTKAGRLTDDEYAMIKMHPVIGERIIKPLGLVPEERAVIRYHHERYDGRGYPDGLVGENIPLLARIVAVTDAFDAMTSTRSYRKALPVETALKEMERCAGTQFDPTVVHFWVDAIRGRVIRLQVPPATDEAMLFSFIEYSGSK